VQSKVITCRRSCKPWLPVFVLAVFWCLGLFLGCSCSAYFSGYMLSWMRAALSGCVSIVGTYISVLLPLVITGVIMLTSSYFLLPILAFFKAFTFSFSVGCIDGLFADAAWLVQPLLLFTDILLLLPILSLWIRMMHRSFESHVRVFLWTLFFAVLVGLIELVVISPFLLKIL